MLSCASVAAQQEEPVVEEVPAPEPAEAEPPSVFSESSYDLEGVRAAPRDAFPVLDHPAMASVTDASLQLDPEEPVIGLFLDGEARAYPISVMGGIELVNDTCGELPVAVSW